MAKSKKAFLKNLSIGKGIISYACSLTGITRATYYNWINKDSNFKKKCEDIQEEILDIVESKLLNKINEEDLTAIIFYLKTKGKKRGYVEKVENEVIANPFWELMKQIPDEE